MLFTKPTLALPPRDFLFLLRVSWQVDNTPQTGRLRNHAIIASRPKSKSPAPYKIAAE